MAAADEAILESVVFLDHFAALPDPRQLSKVIYPIDEILLLSLFAVLAGAEIFTAIAQFGKEKLALLRRFRAFVNGTPDHDRLGEVFAALDPEQFQKCFVGWVATLIGAPAEVIAIDGKIIRRSYQKKGGLNPIHMVSAFAARQRLVLGQVKVAEKSNEIVAIPKLLDMLAIKDAIVTIDAIGCQREIAKKVIDKNADYVLALKCNQGTLHEDVELFANEQKTNNFKDTTIDQDHTVDGDHGRIETRRVTVFHDIGWLQERHNWHRIEGRGDGRERAPDRRPRSNVKRASTSSTGKADKLSDIVRRHWAVERCTG